MIKLWIVIHLAEGEQHNRPLPPVRDCALVTPFCPCPSGGLCTPLPHWHACTFLGIMKRPWMAQFHKICLFLEHRVPFAIIYVTFNNHKRIISYKLWKPHGEMKISLKKKIILLLISTEWKDAHISNFPQSKRTLKHVWSKNHGSGFLCMQVI